MHRFVRLVLPSVLVLGMVSWAPPAGASHPAADHENMDILFNSQNSTNAINSDLAFWGDAAFAGNYNGFRIFDISDPSSPTLVTDFPCDGPQNDVSVWDRDGDGQADILFLSVDAVMEGDECGAARAPALGPFDPADWEGIRIFDVSDPTAPVALDMLYQDCGSHTHTLVPDPDNNRVLLYNSSYSLRPGPTCGPVFGPAAGRDPEHGVIQVSEVSWDPADPLGPVTAAEIAEPPIDYPGDPDNSFDPAEHGLPPGFDRLRACHDIGVHLGIGMAVGACAEQTQLWRLGPDLIPDTANPVWVFDDSEDLNGATGDPADQEVAVDFWHTARFTWDGKYVQADDESFGDGCPPVTEAIDADTGRTHILRTSTGERMSLFMIPRTEPNAYCSMHQGNMIATPGKYLSVNAWYMGGVQILDFTAVKNPKEVAFFDFNPDGATGSDNWAHYWYENANRRPSAPIITYGQDGVHNPATGRGFEVFAAALKGVNRVGVDHMNPQTIEFTIP